MEELRCLRCQAKMTYLKTERIQLGKTGFLLGDLRNLWAGALQTVIYVCPQCGKLEFFRGPDEVAEQDVSLPQKTCPNCGKSHDFDNPKCPFCKYDFYAR